MDELIKEDWRAALDRVSAAADTSVELYGTLAKLYAGVVQERLEVLCRERHAATHELFALRRERGDLPAAGKPDRAQLIALLTRVREFFADDDQETLVRTVRDADEALAEAIGQARGQVRDGELRKALTRLMNSVDAAAEALADIYTGD